MKIAFFDTKPYDIPGFEQFSADTGMITSMIIRAQDFA